MFNEGRILPVRNWCAGFLAAMLAFILWRVAMSKSNPSSLYRTAIEEDKFNPFNVDVRLRGAGLSPADAPTI